MTRVGPPAGAGAAPTPGPSDAERLRGAARQLTGVFAQQLFKAMRETVPRGEGVVDGGSGEELFTGMLDEHLAGATPAAGNAAGAAPGPGPAWTRALAEAVARRLDVTSAAGRASMTEPPNAVRPPLDPLEGR